MLSASIEITYSVHVVLRVRFADSRNFPFSTSRTGLRQRNRW
uniref:Tubby-like F-box protein 8 isoform X2 n=1 Tax=Rhizophora mucronata TaxID=61149 RepID=A0A2P2MFH5_RHIMU